jgi:hypothetical protein
MTAPASGMVPLANSGARLSLRFIHADSPATDVDAAIEHGRRRLEVCRLRAAELAPDDRTARLQVFVEMAQEADFQGTIAALFPDRADEINRLVRECKQLATDMNG